MVLFNYATRELTAKIVYYGPGLCGKTTNLEYIHKSLPDKTRGKMLSLATQTDRTLFFDFLPIDLGSVKGMKTRVQLYTVPGQVFYDATRKLVLKGADGVVFVVDSQKEMIESNLESWENLKQNLKENSLDINTIPVVLQFNKRDLPNVMSTKDLNKRLNDVKAPSFEAIAVEGKGVQETLRGISSLVLRSLSTRLLKDDRSEAAEKEAEAPPAPVVVEEKVNELPASDENSEMALHLEPLDEKTDDSMLEELDELEEIMDPAPLPHAAKSSGKKSKVERTQEVELVADDTELPPPPPKRAPAPPPPAPKTASVASRMEPETSVRVPPVTIRASDQEVNVPIEVQVGREGEEVKLQISFQLKIRVLPK